MVKYDGQYKFDASASTNNFDEYMKAVGESGAGRACFDEYMKAVGVGLVTRKAANSSTPVITVTVNGNHWILKQETAFKTHVQEFDIGVEVETSTPDGRKVKSLVTKDGDTLTEKQTGDKVATLVRVITNDGMKTTCSCDGVTCVRFYKRQ